MKNWHLLSSTIILFLLLSCSQDKSGKMIYNITPITEDSGLSNEWEDSTWKEIQPVDINNFMGDKPDHFPVTQVKVAYDNTAIYVKFKVYDKFIKAVYSKHQDPVY